MFLDPYSIVEQFELTSGMRVADFGVGAGHFAFAMASKVGHNGKVYAFDVREQMLEVVRGYTRIYRLTQVMPMLCNLEQEHASGLGERSLDLVLCSSILHQVQHHAVVLGEAFRILKQNSKIVIIDWEPGGSLKPAKIFTSEQAKHLLSECGFTYNQTLQNAGDHHYGIVGIKQ